LVYLERERAEKNKLKKYEKFKNLKKSGKQSGKSPEKSPENQV